MTGYPKKLIKAFCRWMIFLGGKIGSERKGGGGK